MGRRLIEFPEYHACLSKLEELSVEFGKTRDQARDLEVRLANLRGARVSAATDEVEAEATALVAGNDGGAREVARLRDDLAALRHRARVLGRAVQLQEIALEALRGRLSARVAAEVKEEHRELARRIARAAIELARALEAEAAFRRELSDGGILADVLPAAQLPGFRLAAEGSRIGAFLLRLLGAGLIAVDDLPDELKTQGEALLRAEAAQPGVVPRSRRVSRPWFFET
ncbi:MAG TPA: hypothetical protein VNK67_13370 [Burkholderiales bacterium]|nr:hypothetical protein [Burkholderiales bacterium]